MGNPLSNAFLRAGLVTKEDVLKEEERERSKIGEQMGRLKGKSVQASWMNLEKINSISEFKEVAKQLLIEDPSSETIAEVVRIAHDIKTFDGGKKLIWLILSLRDNLDKVRPDKKEQVIKRALRSSNPTVDVPPDWLQ